MAEVISFQDVLRSRRRRRHQDLTEECARVIELNLRLALELYASAPAEERTLRARHLRQLGELLEFVSAMR